MILTSTLPPQRFETVLIDSAFYESNASIKNWIIEKNNTDTEKVVDVDVFLEFMNNKLLKKEEYNTKSMNTDDMGEYMENTFWCYRECIKVADSIYEFENNFCYSLKKENDVYVAENDLFDIFAYGETMDEAQLQLFEIIDDLWNVYVDEENENLDDNALKLKEKLMNNVRKVR